MKRGCRTSIIAAVLLASGVLCAVAQTGTSFGVYVYPNKGQSEAQQGTDESVCYKSAVAKTGVDPTNLKAAPAPAPTARQGGAVRGAARGAAAGSVIGAITGNAGQGAAIGAASGAMHGYANERRVNEAEQRYAAASAQGQHSKQMDSFKRAYAACLESKGYTAK